MIRETVTINNRKGLHARASAKLNGVVRQFNARVTLVLGDQRADARNIMSIMMLAASSGTEIGLEIDGDDEQDAWKAIHQLINNRFDEDE